MRHPIRGSEFIPAFEADATKLPRNTVALLSKHAVERLKVDMNYHIKQDARKEVPILKRQPPDGNSKLKHSVKSRDGEWVDCKILKEVKPPPIGIEGLVRIEFANGTGSFVQSEHVKLKQAEDSNIRSLNNKRSLNKRSLTVLVTAQDMVLMQFNKDGCSLPQAKIAGKADNAQLGKLASQALK